jgi:hypothetical protein
MVDGAPPAGLWLIPTPTAAAASDYSSLLCTYTVTHGFEKHIVERNIFFDTVPLGTGSASRTDFFVTVSGI